MYSPLPQSIHIIKPCSKDRILNFLTGFSVVCIVILECFANTSKNVFEESVILQVKNLDAKVLVEI